MAGRMKHTMVVRNPDTLEAVALLEGTELPDWATDIVHADNLTDGGGADGEGEEKPYAKRKKAELEALVAERNADRDDDDQIEVGGTGTVKDLAAALDADDAAQADADNE